MSIFEAIFPSENSDTQDLVKSREQFLEIKKDIGHVPSTELRERSIVLLGSIDESEVGGSDLSTEIRSFLREQLGLEAIVVTDSILSKIAEGLMERHGREENVELKNQEVAEAKLAGFRLRFEEEAGLNHDDDSIKSSHKLLSAVDRELKRLEGEEIVDPAILTAILALRDEYRLDFDVAVRNAEQNA